MTSRPARHLDASDHFAALAEEATRRGAPEEAAVLVQVSLSRLQLAIALREQEHHRWRIAAA